MSQSAGPCWPLLFATVSSGQRKEPPGIGHYEERPLLAGYTIKGMPAYTIEGMSAYTIEGMPAYTIEGMPAYTMSLVSPIPLPSSLVPNPSSLVPS